LRSVFDGFAYLATRRILLASFLVDIIAMVFGMPRALFPQIATESFGDPASGGTALGLLFAALSEGAVIGGVFSGWIPRVGQPGRVRWVAVSRVGRAGVGGRRRHVLCGVRPGAPAGLGHRRDAWPPPGRVHRGGRGWRARRRRGARWGRSVRGHCCGAVLWR